MIEVEIKLPLLEGTRPEVIRQALEAQGFSFTSHIREVDTYFDNEAGEIRSSHQAFRLRMEEDLLSGKQKGLVTFKGKRLDEETVTRPEYETEVSDPRNMLMILSSIGFHGVKPLVDKERITLTRTLLLTPSQIESTITACLDKVEGLGHFLELEILIEEETMKPQALQAIEDVLSSLGYSLKDTIQTSYLSMLQAKQ